MYARAILFLFLSLNACQDGSVLISDEIWFTCSTTVFDWFRLHDFINDGVSRNIFGIEKAYFEYNCTLPSDMAT